MAEQGHVGFNAGCERPGAVRCSAQQHGRHGVTVHDGKAVSSGLNEEASIAVTVKCSAHKLTLWGWLQCLE